MAQPDPQLNNLLKWSIENSTPSDPTDQSSRPSRPLDQAALDSLFGGPSDADLMKSSMAAITSSSTSLSDKLTAFDNLEQLIEGIDNANNLSPLGLWTPLLEQLKNEEADLRRMAAWCVGTAVQNNPAAQERALVGGAVPQLVEMVRGEKEEALRRKARYAISSLVRNYQPGLDALLRAMGNTQEKVDAGDMEAVDGLLQALVKQT